MPIFFTFLLSAAVIERIILSRSILSPTLGKSPSLFINKPASVSASMSPKFFSNFSSKIDSSRVASAMYSNSLTWIKSSKSSASCSSSISQTSSSKISSIVTRPEMVPYSSMTIAICDLSFLNSSSNESAFLLSGTILISLIKLFN